MRSNSILNAYKRHFECIHFIVGIERFTDLRPIPFIRYTTKRLIIFGFKRVRGTADFVL